MTDSTGTVQQSYTYGPYGYTSTSGNTTSNSYQYIGRETDAAGLYYLRNRYYNPLTHSFLKEDPMGLTGGPNLFQYAGDNPTTYSDPNGKLFGEGCLLGMAGYELGQALGDLSGRKPDRGWSQARGLAGACALGFLTEGLGPLLEGLGAADGAFADALEGLGPDATDAEQAAASQTSGGYAPDNWSNTTLQPGNLLVQGSPGEGNFFTSLEQFQSSDGTLDSYNQGLQIEPNEDYAPRQGVIVYQVTSPTSAAESQALANPGAGPGGWTQYFISNQSGLCAIYCIPFLP